MAPFVASLKRNYIFGGICSIAANASIKVHLHSYFGWNFFFLDFKMFMFQIVVPSNFSVSCSLLMRKGNV
jgi:hypothetical protein